MLRFSVNLSMLLTEHELIDRFGLAKLSGFDAVEIQFPYEANQYVLKQALDEHELTLVLFNVAADDLLAGGEGLAAVPEKQQEFRKAVAEAVDYAQILKPSAINVLPGRALKPELTRLYRETFIENLAYATTEFSKIGVKTVFEAINTYDMPGFIIHGGEQMLAIIKEINHPNLFMQYDLYHMQMMGENAQTFIADHAEQIGHIQFADVPGRGQPGTGDLNFQALFSTIEASRYRGWVGAEYKPVGDSRESFAWLKR